MKPMRTDSRTLAVAVLSFALIAPASAAVLYKSVGADGVLHFSDLPPEKGRLVERMHIPDAAGGSSTVGTAAGPSREVQIREVDAAVAQANAQLDMAERSLAEARRKVLADSDPMRLATARADRADIERIEFHKKSVLAARQALLEVLQQKRNIAVPQTQTASNVWVPVNPGARQ